MKEANTIILGQNDLDHVWKDTPVEKVQCFMLAKINQIYDYDLVIFIDEQMKCNILVNKFGNGGIVKLR